MNSSSQFVAAARHVSLEARARQSLGSSHEAIYRMVAREFESRRVAHAHLVDIGCGGGALFDAVRPHLSSYRGLDAVRYERFPVAGEFLQVDLDADLWPVPDGTADVVTAVEVIEHLENPWAFMRRLAGLAKPGGLLFVTTPNQLSLLSLMTLVAKRRFSAFQDAHYPAHRTALLESDLRRAAAAAGLEPGEIVYSGFGRLPLSAWHYPRNLAASFPQALSDNLMLVARKPPTA
jgi:2-polyprenyl-3-methyl-5-hydroxy-6-metoxy-1,4-benzoquinol methylase